MSCGVIMCSDDCCLLWIIDKAGRVDVIVVVVDNAFKLGADNNPLPLAVKADDKGIAAMANKAERRRPICTILFVCSIPPRFSFNANNESSATEAASK